MNVRIEVARRVAAIAIAVVMSLVATHAAAATPGKMTKERYVFNGGRTITYYLFLPKTVAAPAPMLVLLHGSGRNGSTLVEPWRKIADREGIILVGPDAANTAQWAVPEDGPAAIGSLILELRKTLPVDPRRIYLFGHSAGAVFALYMSALESRFFAATALHAGALPPENQSAVVAQAERKIPIGIWVGDSDPFFPVAPVSATAAAFRNAGHTVQMRVMTRHDHNYYVVADSINPAIWSFLRDYRLDADPVLKEYEVAR